jgi:hypothetical protein
MRSIVCVLVILGLLAGNLLAVAPVHADERGATAGLQFGDDCPDDGGRADDHCSACDHLCCHPGMPASSRVIHAASVVSRVETPVATFDDRPSPALLEPPRTLLPLR